MRTRRTWLFVLGCICPCVLPAQQNLRNLSSFDFYESFAPMGDVDGDGYEDIMVTSLIYVGPWISSFDEELRIYSGRDGSLLRRGPRWADPDQARAFPTGDHDHDGMRDYIVMDTDYTNALRRISVRSGRDDHILWIVQNPFTYYWAVDVIGDLDVNGDGELDVVVSNPVGNSAQGEIWAYDHQGSLIYHKIGTGMINSLAQSIAKLGDVNGDGCDDYIAGLGDPNWYGAVAILSGPTGDILRVVTGQNQGDYIGSGCVGCGDLDGDGLPDFAAGGGLSGSPGSVQAFSSATGARLFAVYSGFVGDRFGAVLRAADYDRDGIDDFIAAGWGGMRVVSGREGAIIALYVPQSPASLATFYAQPLQTPSGFPRLVLQTQVLGTYLMSAQPHDSRILGSGCSMTPSAPMPLLGMRELETPIRSARRLTLAGAEPGSPAFLLLGWSSQAIGPQSLAAVGLPQCAIYPNLEVVGGFTTGTAGIDAGFARHDFTAPSIGGLGIAVDAQWLTLDGSLMPAGLSDAIRFMIRN